MIANIANRGSSFKGLANYLLHNKTEDRKQADGEFSKDTDRVEWIVSRNLAVKDEDNLSHEEGMRAFRLMAYTAMNQERLKEEAGVKSTGRKHSGEVYHYSIAWHDDEKGKFTKEEMIEAAEESLERLGLSGYQSVICAHNDENHPHLHIAVNLVSTNDGKIAPLRNDYNKLDRWGYDYREKREEDRLYCYDRTLKYEAIKRKELGLDYEYHRGAPSMRPEVAQALKKLKQDAKNDNMTIPERDLKAALDLHSTLSHQERHLSEFGVKQVQRHDHEKVSLDQKHKWEVKDLKRKERVFKRDARQKVKDTFTPSFRDLYIRQAKELGQWAREGKLLGITGAQALKAQKISWNVEDEHFTGKRPNFLKLVFSSKSRKCVLEAQHRQEIKSLRTLENRHMRHAMADFEKRMVQMRDHLHKKHVADRKSLHELHLIDRDKLQMTWRIRTDRRKEALEMIKLRGKLVDADKAKLGHEKPVIFSDDRPDAEQDFNKSAKTKRKRKRRPRTKTRE